MAKGVLLGVIGCVTILPALILVFDKPLQKTKHRSIIPSMDGFAKGVTKVFPIFLIVFVLLVYPAWYGYDQTNGEVYYDLGECLPEDMAVSYTHLTRRRSGSPWRRSASWRASRESCGT